MHSVPSPGPPGLGKMNTILEAFGGVPACPHAIWRVAIRRSSLLREKCHGGSTSGLCAKPARGNPSPAVMAAKTIRRRALYIQFHQLGRRGRACFAEPRHEMLSSAGRGSPKRLCALSLRLSWR